MNLRCELHRHWTRAAGRYRAPYDRDWWLAQMRLVDGGHDVSPRTWALAADHCDGPGFLVSFLADVVRAFLPDDPEIC